MENIYLGIVNNVVRNYTDIKSKSQTSLSGRTGWTPNQNAADKLSNWTVKSGGASNLVKGELIDLSTLPELNRNGSFIKLFEENGVLKTTLK
jgi:hypothetical protein